MADHDALIARAHAGKRIADFLADPEVHIAYQEIVSSLESRILGFDPKETENFTIARAMLLGIQEFWGALGSIVARGREAEAVMDGIKTTNGPGRIL
jgi:hypothetical protein